MTKKSFTATSILPDMISLFLIILIYSIFALHDLGSTTSPQTTYSLGSGDYIMLDFGESYPVRASFFMAPGNDRDFTLYTWDYTIDEWVIGNEFTVYYCFTWTDVEFDPYSSQVLIQLLSEDTDLIELAFFDSEGNRIIPQNANEYATLFDEQSLFDGNSDFRSSMYFDEIYHARTAYEMIHDIPIYETTHPPFGKFLLSLGIRIFGMTPFGWRISGTLIGILMLPFLYFFIKKMLKDTFLASIGTFIFAFDFMHFVQTRIATIDVYVTFFILLMYYFMYLYLSQVSQSVSAGSTGDSSKHFISQEYVFLALSGICMGFGVASKWTGVYAGAGLAVLFFATWFKLYPKIKSKTERIKKAKCTFLYCILFFVVIPAIIYILSYLPVNDGTDHNLLKRMWDNQLSMLDYHKNLVATHSFSSPFFAWPIMIRPVWYYSRILDDTMREGISSFGNPLVWWIGIFATLFLIYYAIKKKDRKAAFLVVGYFAQYLPWFFVSRITFIYHYFPSVIFVVLMITYCMSLLKSKLSGRVYYSISILYAVAVFGMFLFFYPVLSGQGIDADYVDKYLEWLPSWYFVVGN